MFKNRIVANVAAILIYSKTAIQAVKKGMARPDSPTQDGQGEKVGNQGGSQEIAVMVSHGKIFLIKTIQVNLCPH